MCPSHRKPGLKLGHKRRGCVVGLYVEKAEEIDGRLGPVIGVGAGEKGLHFPDEGVPDEREALVGNDILVSQVVFYADFDLAGLFAGVRHNKIPECPVPVLAAEREEPEEAGTECVN